MKLFKKRYLVLVLALAMVFSFAACGGGSDTDGADNNGLVADAVCDLTVNISDSKTAQMMVAFPDDEIQTCAIAFGGYEVYLNKDWTSGEYSCTLTQDNVVIEDQTVDFDVKGNIVTFNMDMSDFEDFDFNELGAYSTLTCSGADEPLTTIIHEAANVVK